ncbi:MAG: ribonuclease H-like domain-containing protein [Candidatus Woesearchaeota archaeon]|jgi:hypothetical protein
MIKKHFSFIEGVTPSIEREIYSRNMTWDDFLKSKVDFLSKEKYDLICSSLNVAKEKLELRDHIFFMKNLSKREHFRLFEYFYDHIGFLDIETTGLSKEGNVITTISVYDGNETKTFIRGINMDEKELKKYLSKFKMLVTFNGICFDVPFIQHHFPSAISDILHIDLRWISKRVGLSGGLKRIEKIVGVSRDGDISEVDGLMAVRLWKKYEKYGDKKALDLLVKYNRADVENLKTLCLHVIGMIKSDSYFDAHTL